jgi:hypothetical protein
MKKRILVILSIVIASVSVLLILNEKGDQINKKDNGFTRKSTYNIAKLLSRTTKNNTVSDVVGITGDTLFLSDRKAGVIYISDTSLSRIDTININLPDSLHLEPLFFTTVKYPRVYIMGGNARTIVCADLNTKKIEVKFIGGDPFTGAIAFRENEIIFKRISHESLSPSFNKVNFKSLNIQTDNGQLLPQLGDAGFTHDGKLVYDSATNRFVYTCFYNNQFYCFDTSFNLVYKGHTIDTTSTAKKITEHKGRTVNQAKPPLMVNAFSAAFGGKLYVKSKLRADNEDYDKFNSLTTIDVYDIKTGKYLDSFSVPSLDNQKVVRFRVIKDDEIIVRHENNLAKYSFQTTSLLQ